MSNIEVFTTIISFIGTAIGAVTGILVSNRLSTYRIEQLEKKFDSFDKKIDDRFDKYENNEGEIKERLVVVEQSSKSAHRRLDDIVGQLNIHERRE